MIKQKFLCPGCQKTTHDTEEDAAKCCRPVIVYCCDKCQKWSYFKETIGKCCESDKKKFGRSKEEL